MCGIAGLYRFSGKQVAPEIPRAMAAALAHRGPDGAGDYTEGPIGLGHRRLAILDLSTAGRQPMRSADGRFILVYNGEVYNFRELRDELEECGYQFFSRTDTEVVLNAFAEWGRGCLDRFNGMFAFALWDGLRKELFLARDRYGIKPLYYSAAGDSFYFASEQKAILSQPDVAKETDLEALREYFTFQNIFTGKTLIKNISLFPAGSWLKLGPRSGPEDVIPRRYWDYHFQEPSVKADDEEYIEEMDRLFRQAVCRQLVSDVDLGSYLSGGMDSGSITAVAAGELPYIKTFTCGFDLHSASGMELAFDEREAAEHMSYLFRTEHYEMVLKAGDMERIMPKLAWHLEEPRVGQSYPNYYVAQLASKFVKVVLAGTGGDEIFGGYPWRYYRAVVNDDFDHYVDRYYGFWQRLIPDVAHPDVFKPIWNEVRHVEPRDIFKGIFTGHESGLSSPEDYVNHSLYFEARTFLHGLLVVEDKLGMANGLETRVPFLDNDLVDFAMTVPMRLKLRNLTEVVSLNENEPGSKYRRFTEKTDDGKLILRRLMERHIPPEVTGAAKQGFSAPDASWFRGESMEYVRHVVDDDRSPIFRYLDRVTVRRLVEEHLRGDCNRRLFIWSLLNLDAWCLQYGL